MRLLHLTDTHLHSDVRARLRGVETWRTLSQVLRRAAEGPHKPDAVLATGDLSQDETQRSYQHFSELLSPLEVPVWCVPGNHDAPLPMAETLATPPFHIGGAQVGSGWCVVLLNTFVPQHHDGRVANSQLEWLDAMLAEQRERHVLIALHHPPLQLGSRWLDELGLQNALDLLAIVDRSPQVRAVVAGHVHQASDILRNGVRYLTTPSTCFQFLPQSDMFALDTRPPGFRWLELLPDGRIETQVVWVDNP